MAFALRDRWLVAGVLVALGVMSQEFAILVAVPLFFMAPGKRRREFFVGVTSTVILALAALATVSSPRLVWDALFGSIYTSTSDTVVMTLHLHGSALVFITKVLPVLISVVVSWWVVARRSFALRPVVLTSLVAVSLTLRLVFEQNMFGYYYMALAVTLVGLNVIEGRIRSSLVAWLVMVFLTYLAGTTTTFVQLQRASWGNEAQQIAAPLVALLAVAIIGFGLACRARFVGASRLGRRAGRFRPGMAVNERSPQPVCIADGVADPPCLHWRAARRSPLARSPGPRRADATTELPPAIRTRR